MATASEKADVYHHSLSAMSNEESESDGEIKTQTLVEQRETQRSVYRHFRLLQENPSKSKELLTLQRSAHQSFLRKRLHALPTAFESMDASQPWLCYWTVHALYLLSGVDGGDSQSPDVNKDQKSAVPHEVLSEAERRAVVNLLKSCLTPDGGFGGGPHQMAHLATTYGAVNCMVELNEVHRLEAVERDAMRAWLLRLRTPGGAFRLQEDGEVDARGAYCAVSVARLLGLLDHEAGAQLFKDTANWLVSCQTYEGGFGAAPGLEAHGGYSFCGFAALCMLGKAHLCDLRRLTRWAVARQMAFEGGFQGRTNKLVDSCYSWWIGGLFPLLHQVLSKLGDGALSADHWLFDTDALQEYLLLCCQRPAGGLIDKPGRNPDPYHCCYALSGLSAAQHFNFARFMITHELGSADNLLRRTDTLHNVAPRCVDTALEHFRS